MDTRDDDNVSSYSVLHNKENAIDPKNLKICNLTQRQVYAYGIGHFFNDVAAAAWFNYLLIYLTLVHPVIPDDPTAAAKFAGLIMLVGQIVDGIATPIIGTIMDRAPTCCGMGRKRPFYLFGTFFVGVSLVFQFTVCFVCTVVGNDSLFVVYINYLLWPIMVNISWPMVQIAHMSLPPAISNSRKTRDRLSNLRNAFTFFAFLACFIVALILFNVIPDPLVQYQYLAYILTIIGLCTSCAFVIGIPEKKLTVKTAELRQTMISFNENFDKSMIRGRKALMKFEAAINDFVEE